MATSSNECGDKKNGQLTLKSLSVLLGMGLTALATMQVVHSSFVVPAVLREARKETIEEIERHERNPHQSSVSRNEWQVIRAQLDRIEARLERLEKR